MAPSPSKALPIIQQYVDKAVAEVEAQHQGRLQCARGCHACCVDGLTVFEVEAQAIRQRHADLLTQGTPHPQGACALLNADGACRIYPDRPYVCRTQGLPLRWLQEDAQGNVEEHRDVCELNLLGEPSLVQIGAAACWPIGPVEQKLRELQESIDGGEARRVALRDLFGTPSTDS